MLKRVGGAVNVKSDELQPRRRPRQRRSEQTRDRILDAAVDVFTRFGYDRGTTNRIAAWADVSVGSLYQYYPNKDAIIAELVARHLDAGIAAGDWCDPAGSHDVIGDVLRTIVSTSVANHAHDPAFLRLLFEQAPRSETLMSRVVEQHEAAVTTMREFLESRPEVTVADTHAAAHLVVTTVHVVVHQMLALAQPFGADVVEDEVVRMLTRYLTGPIPGAATPRP